MLFNRNTILRKDMCVAVIGYEDKPKLFVCLLVEIFQIMFDWLFPTDGKQNEINNYNRKKRDEWVREFCITMIKKLQEKIDILDKKNINDFL